MRTLVTGAAGFIGSTLVDRLLADGHQVVGIDNFVTGTAANLESAFRCSGRGPGQFTFVRADIQAPELADILAGANPDVIFHLAAHVDVPASVSDPQFDARGNVLGTINLCDASRRAGVQRIVYAASGTRYGLPTRLPVDETAQLDPLSPYAVAKLSGEMYLRAYAGMYGMAPICLALADVYGPRQNFIGEAGVIAAFGSAMITGHPVTVCGDGTSTRDFVYVGDVVDAFVCAAQAPSRTVGTYNIGSGRPTTVNGVHHLFSLLLGELPPPRYAAARRDEWHAIAAVALCTDKAEKELGWKPSVDLACGIQRTIDWLRAQVPADEARRRVVGANS